MNVFEETSINGMKLRNRFIRSATIMGLAEEDGSSTPRLNATMKALAEGGVALSMTGFAYVQKGGRVLPMQLGCHDDKLVPRLTEMAIGVHQGGGKIALQMVHCGIFSNTELSEGDAAGPSALQTKDGLIGRALTKAEIDTLIGDYAAAAGRAQKAGFDAVQIHAAHGYQLGQFLSPFFNKREDEYGGSLENRARLLIQVYESVRNTVGDNYPVLTKINSEDLLADGFSVEEMLQVSAMLEKAGIDAVELSGGTGFASHIKRLDLSPFPVDKSTVYWRDAAQRYKERIDIPLILVGGIRSIEDAEEILNQGTADYISMSRPLIREPGLINRWKSGDRRPSECVSDNACFAPGYAGEGVRCVHVT